MKPDHVQPHVVEQFRNLVWYQLDNDLISSAIFTAERLHAYDPKNADCTHLLAVCLFRDRQYLVAEALTKNWLRHVGCAYIFAQCCLKLGGGKQNAGVVALEGCKRLWVGTSSWDQHTSTSRRTLPDAAAINTLLAQLQSAVGDNKKAVDAYVQAVRVNPFIWEAFTGLCDSESLGVNLRVNNIFKQTHDMTAALRMPFEPSAIPEERQTNNRENMQDPFASSHSGRDRSNLNFSNHPSFYNRLNEGVVESQHEAETPTQSSNSSNADLASAIEKQPPPIARKTRAGVGDKKLASRATPAGRSTSATETAQRRSTRIQAHSVFRGKIGTERETRMAAKEREAKKPKAAVRSRSVQMSGNAALSKEQKDRGVSEDVNVRAPREFSQPPSPRSLRSSAQAESVPTRAGAKRKPTQELALTHGAKKQMSDAPSKPPLVQNPSEPPQDAKKKEAQMYLLELWKKLGTAYFALVRYNCKDALEMANTLPLTQKETPWVQSLIGRAYYEMANYPEAEVAYAKVRKLDPVRTEGMEIYSSVLWHQHKEVQLSYLAHELIDVDKTSAQSWCALGNCFALQRDHDQALKCFKRASLLNPKLAYTFTLTGLEHIANEEYEKALVAFRNSLAADSRHYNAWYGLGRVYEILQKFDAAAKHFKTAAKINPNNPVLTCCIGSVLEKTADLEGALKEFSQAVIMAPRSAMSRFKKARTLLGLRRPKEALSELMVLKDVAPDEANVHFLLGRVYKALHDKNTALKHLTIALNLDPKAGQLIKEVIENLGEDDEEDMIGEDSYDANLASQMHYLGDEID